MRELHKDEMDRAEQARREPKDGALTGAIRGAIGSGVCSTGTPITGRHIIDASALDSRGDLPEPAPEGEEASSLPGEPGRVEKAAAPRGEEGDDSPAATEKDKPDLLANAIATWEETLGRPLSDKAKLALATLVHETVSDGESA